EKSVSEKWYDQRGWQKLLHFEPGLFGKLTGQVDSPQFYLSAERTLQTEMEGLIQKLKADVTVPEVQSTWCLFPARVSYLKKRSPNLNWPKVACPKFQKYEEALRGQSLSLVFSSYYLNNPSSAFGHTFLRINKFPSAEGKRYELLDYGINFAANQDSTNPLVYTFNGLFGGFEGRFSSIPYYYKVREYANAEKRDLWEYELNFDEKDVKYFIEHIWELGPNYIDYWYLTENCSYHMLSILEVLKPELNLLARLKFDVIPTDTVMVVWSEPGLVKGFYFRPSIRTEFLKRYEKLTQIERSAFLHIIRDRKIPDLSEFSPQQQANILDAGMDWVDSEFAQQVQEPNSPESKFKAEILTARSKVNFVTDTLIVTPPVDGEPHLSHASRRWGLGYLHTAESGNFGLFNYRFALHDFLDPQLGYPSYAEILFLDFGFSYSDRTKKLESERVGLFEVISLSPWTEVYRRWSWRLYVGSDRFRNQNCDFCHGFQVSYGAGVSKTWDAFPQLTGYLGMRFTGIGFYSAEPNARAELQAGPNLLLRFNWSRSFQTTVEGLWKDNFKERNRYQREWTIGTQLSGNDQNFGTRLVLKDYGFDKYVGLQWIGYH
ncbi:MAG: DUF4105 domain-containing protein, partial [Bdellovibrionota bacterium]